MPKVRRLGADERGTKLGGQGHPLPPEGKGTVYLCHENTYWGSDRTHRPRPLSKEVPLTSRTVDLLAEAPGKHEVSLLLDLGADSGDCPGPVIEIKDRAQRQEFRIRFDPEKVRAALEQAGELLKSR